METLSPILILSQVHSETLFSLPPSSSAEREQRLRLREGKILETLMRDLVTVNNHPVWNSTSL